MPHDHDGWVLTFKKHVQIEWKVIELFSDNWLQLIQNETFDVLALRPPGRSSFYKQIYDDRIQFLSSLYPDKLYPNVELVKIYENKRYFRDWLLVNKIPHPKTWIFYSKEHALQFLNVNTDFPLVSKLNIGASGKGVEIQNDQRQVIQEISELFGDGKIIKGTPNIRKGSFIKKIKKIFTNPAFIKLRLKEYQQQSNEVHKNYIILQEYIQHEFEWRCVVIGDSYFAHKKLIKSGKTSGSLLKKYENPPIPLLDFIRNLSLNHNIDSAAIDIFEHNGTYLVNEIQCFFGQSDEHQMIVNNIPGRYIWIDKKWCFEKGSFNENQCFDLRLKHITEKFGKNSK